MILGFYAILLSGRLVVGWYEDVLCFGICLAKVLQFFENEFDRYSGYVEDPARPGS